MKTVQENVTEIEHNLKTLFLYTSVFTVEKFNYEGLCKALEQLSDFEKRANSRVVQSGVLKGLNLEDIKRAGQGLILQDGCTGFFQKILKNDNLKADVNVLSYCWCGDFIKSAFSSGIIFVLEQHIFVCHEFYSATYVYLRTIPPLISSL